MKRLKQWLLIVLGGALAGCTSIDEVAAVRKAQLAGMADGKLAAVDAAIVSLGGADVARQRAEKLSDVEADRARYKADLKALMEAGRITPGDAIDEAMVIADEYRREVGEVEAEAAELSKDWASLSEALAIARLCMNGMTELDAAAIDAKNRMAQGIAQAVITGGMDIAEDVIAAKAERERAKAEEKLRRQAERDAAEAEAEAEHEESPAAPPVNP